MRWDRITNLILAGVLALAIFVMATAINAMFGTNSRIDAIYPTLTDQARDVGEIKGDLRIAADRLDRASRSIEAIEGRLADTVEHLSAIANQVERAVAAQEAQGHRIDDLVNSVRYNTDALGGVIERLEKLEPASAPFGLEQRGLLEVTAFQWADIKASLERRGYGIVNLGDVTAIAWDTAAEPGEAMQALLEESGLLDLSAHERSSIWLLSSSPETARKLREIANQR